MRVAVAGFGLAVVAACSSKSTAPPAQKDAAIAAGPREVELPQMGVALTLPPGWRPDSSVDRSRPNSPRQSQVITSGHHVISVHRMPGPIKTLDEARTAIAAQMFSTRMGTVHEATELPGGTLRIVFDAIDNRSSGTNRSIRVIVPGTDPRACNGSEVGDTDFALVTRICSSLRQL